MSDVVESKEFSFWTKSVLCLQTAKKAFHRYVTNTLKSHIESWPDEEKCNIKQFVTHVNDGRAKFKFVVPRTSQTKTATWICKCVCVGCTIVFNRLLSLQQKPSFSNIAWKCNKVVPSVDSAQEYKTTSKAESSLNKISKNGVDYFIWKIDNGVLLEVRSNNCDHEPIKWDPPKKQTSQEEMIDWYWSMANVFMCKNGDDIQSPCPEDTDISMFFNLMKNCKLFNLQTESFRYDQILATRNQLMHSSKLQVSELEMKAIFENTNALLMHFPDERDCKNAVIELQQLLLKELLISSVDPSQRLEYKQLTKEALTVRIRELHTDITIAESIQSDPSFLKENETQTEHCLSRIANIDQNTNQFPSGNPIHEKISDTSLLESGEQAEDCLRRLENVDYIGSQFQSSNLVSEEVIYDRNRRPEVCKQSGSLPLATDDDEEQSVSLTLVTEDDEEQSESLTPDKEEDDDQSGSLRLYTEDDEELPLVIKKIDLLDYRRIAFTDKRNFKLKIIDIDGGMPDEFVRVERLFVVCIVDENIALVVRQMVERILFLKSKYCPMQ